MANNIYVESKVPKDLKKYKSKSIGQLTLRQFICFATCVILDILLYVLVFKNINVSIRIEVYLYALFNIPVLMFLFEPEGIKMEVYIKHVYLRSFIYPRFRKYKDTNKPKPYVISEKEMKERMKQIPALIKEHPELKKYR